jgi:DNA helicase HerA-like ATPase
LFSTFMMWLIADLFAELPEVGDADKPKLVFFLDEAHLLFRDASRAFLNSIMTTVRLIRSKGVGVFFVTQTPKDVPEDVLGQLANRIQHALRAFTPDDAKALKATVSTFPVSGYDLEEVLTTAGTGEAAVTVMNERGAPTPVAWTRMYSPESTMGPSPAAGVDALIQSSGLLPKYGPVVDSVSAYEKLAAASDRPPAAASGPGPAGPADVDAEARRIEEEILGRPAGRPAGRPGTAEPEQQPRSTSRKPAAKAPAEHGGTSEVIRDFAVQAATAFGRELARGLFGTRRRRRR